MFSRFRSLRRDAAAAEFARLEPWITRFEIGGRAYGGSVSFENDPRIAQFRNAFPHAQTILELGSLEGGQTFQLARWFPKAHILGVEGRPANVEKARLVQRLLDIKNVEFRHGNLETMSLLELGHFDAVHCVGVLYHLPRPWELLDSFPDITDRVLVSTHYADVTKADAEVDGIPGHWYEEFGYADPLSGLSAKSFWMTLPAIIDRLERNGFHVDVVADGPHPHGPIASLVAEKT